MVIRLSSPLRKLPALFLTILAAAYLAYHIGLRAYVNWCIQQPAKEHLQRAIALDPGNCAAYFQLGAYYTFILQDLDLSHGEALLRQATRCQPLEGSYWLVLASALEANGRPQEATAAAQKGAALQPHNTLLLWRSGNLFLRTGQQEKAFEQFYRVLQGSPDFAQQVFTACWNSTDDGDLILRKAIPDTLDLDLAYLRYLASPENLRLDEAQKAWNRLLGLGQGFPPEKTWDFFDALLNSGRAEQATRDWDQMVVAGCLPHEEMHATDDLVVNGGFEADPAGGGLDWRIVPVPGAVVETDNQTRHSGSKSLVVHFEGLTNLNFAHVAQVVPVKPQTEYRFSASVKSRALTTLSGPYFEIFDPGDPVNFHWESKPVLGTIEWSEQSLSLRTGPQTQLLIIRLRRKPAVELDKRIQGSLWIDDVHLSLARPNL